MPSRLILLLAVMVAGTVSCRTLNYPPSPDSGPDHERDATHDGDAESAASDNGDNDDDQGIYDDGGFIAGGPYHVYGGSTRVGVRDLLVRGKAEREGLGAYAYLIMRRGTRNQERHRRVCEAFLTLDGAEEHVGDIAPEQLMVTFWPLKRALTARPRELTSGSCQELVEKYDFRFSTRVASVLGMAGVEGPVLVAWSTPFASRQSGAQVLVFDLTMFSDENLERALAIWQGQISRDPAYWADGWQVVRFREAVRNLVDAGAQIVLTVLGYE